MPTRQDGVENRDKVYGEGQSVWHEPGQVVLNVWLVFPFRPNLGKMNSPLTSQWRGTKQTHAHVPAVYLQCKDDS